MLGVLAIIGMLSVGGIWGFSEAMERHKLNKSKAQLSAILNAVSVHLYDNQAAPEERLSLIPYYKYKTPAIFDDMPIVKSDKAPYESLKDAMGAYIAIYNHNKYFSNIPMVGIMGNSQEGFLTNYIDFMNIDTRVAYCRNLLSVLQPIYKDNPKKFWSIEIWRQGLSAVTPSNLANMSVGQMTTFCYDTLTAGDGKFLIFIYFNKK